MEEEIEQLKKELKEEETRIAYKDNHGDRAIRLKKKIQLLELGCKVEEDPHGLLVNNKFIVGVGKKRWCVAGKYKWYYYSDIPTFVNKYVKAG
jgi:hypothetical protein